MMGAVLLHCFKNTVANENLSETTRAEIFTHMVIFISFVE